MGNGSWCATPFKSQLSASLQHINGTSQRCIADETRESHNCWHIGQMGLCSPPKISFVSPIDV